ncbi:MAG: conjugal transfer protein TrbM [Neisseriaceae bacterium]|nr:conjugal transfer protein TrbM [Neisseriaceae bacterium]MBQ9725550.1 conjugal transfer protein TrbM [Neisseriaceae bacterium]
MKKFALLPILAILSLSATADAGSLKDAVKDELTGDTKLACEALLCLSSSERPKECQESIHCYFSIHHHKKPHRTIEMRRDFLNLCPATDEDENMPSLVNAIANGAGKCDLASLNQNAAFQCRSWYDRETGERRSYCNPQLPSYCSAYYNHAYTDIAKPKWQCTRIEKEPRLVQKERQFKIEYTEICTAGKWVL